MSNRPFAYDIRRLAMNLPTQMTTVFERLLNDGQITAALEHIRAHLDSDSAEAVFLAAHLSISGETSEVFEERSIRQLRAAAAKSYAPAILQLGMRYLFGDSVEIDVARGHLLQIGSRGRLSLGDVRVRPCFAPWQGSEAGQDRGPCLDQAGR
ncbi:hypothetical protein [Stenotrophomonas lactitubi]